MEEKRIVEINGVKIEVDLRTAKRVDQFKVGDAVKVLVKTYSGYESHLGMIVGFDEFKSLPTIIVAYLVGNSYSECPLKFAYLNEKSTDIEICPHNPNDMGVDKADILASFDRHITKKELELREVKEKREYFNSMFGKLLNSLA